jgi:hypothetical protein
MGGCGDNNAGASSTFDSGLGGGGHHHDATTDVSGGGRDTGALGQDGDKNHPGADACATTTATADISPLDIFMLLDRSGSMGDNDSWLEEVQAIENFVYDVDSNGIGVGIQYMPLPALCDPSQYAMPAVPVGVLPAAAAQIVTSLTNSRPFGGTPMVPALQGAIQFAQLRQQANPGRDIVLVLSSDGLPDTSCSFAGDGGLPNSTQNAIKVLSAAASATPPIKTFVIGIGNQPALDAFAAAGGTGKAILVGATDGGGVTDIETPLIAALASIRSQALPCQYTIPQPEAGTINPGEVNVTFTPSSGALEPFYGVSDATACTTSSFDWYFDNPASPKYVELCPSACTAVKAVTKGSVKIVYGCTTWSPPAK